MGRLLHILPSREKPHLHSIDPSNWSLKKQREMKLKAQATNDFNWNTLYMNVNISFRFSFFNVYMFVYLFTYLFVYLLE